MWQLDNRTPYAAERTWVRARNGAEIWLVAVKGTFAIKPDGTTDLAGEQPPPVLAPEYWGEPAKSSLKYDSDLVRTKLTTDVVLHGHAYAPPGKMVTEIDVGFRVGPVVKALRIFGDRVWMSGSSFTPPRPFVKMPILWERAFGGADAKAEKGQPAWDDRNPLGTGYAVSPGHLKGVLLPNIEYAQFPITSGSDKPPPAGFGPIGSHWQPRAKHAGTYDDAWLQTRMPLLPDDFDDRHYQCAPADQQAPEFLKGGEPVAIRNLTQDGELRFYLPRVFLGLETHFYDGTRQLHSPPKVHTVILEPDHPRVSLIWHSSLPCHSKGLKLNRTMIIEKQVLGGKAPDAPAMLDA